MNPPIEPDDLRELMLRHLEGETSPEETRQLSATLRSSSEAQREYAELLVQVTQLRTLGREQNVLALDRIETSRANVWWSAGGRWAIAAAACLIAVAGWFYFTRPTITDSQKELVEDSDSMVVATLTRGAGLVWDSVTNAELEVGTSLEPGLLRLKSGVAELEFLNGARVILEGPAEFELISEDESRLNFGKLRAQVPEPAHGFKVYTPQMIVTDLGTEFALNEQPNQPPEVHVFVGKVQLEFGNTNQPGRELLAGEGVLVEPNNRVEDIRANPKGFVGSEELQEREAKELKARYEQWKKSAADFAADPAMLVYFNFETGQRTNGQVFNLAQDKKNSTDGKTMGAKWASGRWPDKGAVQFADRRDRVRLKVPGTFESLTYAAWVSIDNLSRPNNALAMSQRFKPGDVHWDINSAGSLRLGVRGANSELKFFTGPRLMKSWRDRWVHLAAVYDGPGKAVSLYVNGKRVASHKITEPVPLALDDLELGNWSPLLNPPAKASDRKERQKASFRYREFQGRMDEFALLSRPFSAEEIRKLYEAGKPRSEAILSAQAQPQK